MHMKTTKLNKTEYFRCRKGFTLIEVLVTMALMSIFISMIYSLFLAGGRTYKVSYDSYKAQNEARIAMSYITTKIRQNDSVDDSGLHNISLKAEAPILLGRKYLDISDGAGGHCYIYESNGLAGVVDHNLMESTVNPFNGAGTVIAEGFTNITFDTSLTITGATSIEITIKYNGNQDELKETVTLRADAS